LLTHGVVQGINYGQSGGWWNLPPTHLLG
jgi:hypothetical protein